MGMVSRAVNGVRCAGIFMCLKGGSFYLPAIKSENSKSFKNRD